MKPHVHKDLIIAWANGAEIQSLNTGLSGRSEWVDLSEPSWNRRAQYRIKPREFKNDAYYPVLDGVGDEEIAWYMNGEFSLVGDPTIYKLDDFKWIGEELKIDWPESE